MKPLSTSCSEVRSLMEACRIDCGDLPVEIQFSRFRGTGGVEELHLMATPTQGAPVQVQLDWLDRAYQHALASLSIASNTAILRRFFCSDPVNQASELEACPLTNPKTKDDLCAQSWVGQSPGGPAKIAMWAYHFCDPNRPLDKSQTGPTLILKRGELSHHWTMGMTCSEPQNSYGQTQGILAAYEAMMKPHEMTLGDHVLRTWFFVRDIDTNYKGLVDARRELFTQRGLTTQTHYIASSGIDGTSVEVDASVVMDAYAIEGVRSEQVQFIEASDHLSPTHTYGVTFERATSIAYQDRKHILISGTASIDAQGQIMHQGNVSRQLDRTLENIEALLNQAGATAADMTHWIVYLRDDSDCELIRQKMRQSIGQAPMVVVTAPVCRPGWLVEIEGSAIVPVDNPALPRI